MEVVLRQDQFHVRIVSGHPGRVARHQFHLFGGGVRTDKKITVLVAGVKNDAESNRIIEHLPSDPPNCP